MKTDLIRIEKAIGHLKSARKLCKGHPKVLDRIRGALKSADGARRHAELIRIREMSEATKSTTNHR